MFRGHNNIVYGGQRNFLYNNVCNVIRFRGNQKYRKHVHGDDIQDALSPSNFHIFNMASKMAAKGHMTIFFNIGSNESFT